jgi:hemerythrin-like domain-containing protein
VTATTALRSEHDTILAMIACLREACATADNFDRFDVVTFQAGVDFIRNYADSWHHAKEENLLFPALEAAGMPREGGPVAVMLHEHVLGRTYVQKIADHLEAAIKGDNAARSMVLRFTLAYADLLTQHIQKENNILFNMADQFLSPDEHACLENQYKTAIPDGADPNAGSYYEEIVAQMCERWSVDPREAARVGEAFRCG